MSFMGKGVTKNAVMSLLHLSHEMMSESKEKVKMLYFMHTGTIVNNFIFSVVS